MKLISNLNVNGNHLMDGDKNIGPIVKDDIAPVNSTQITLDALRTSILKDGKVPVDFTFEEFIERLFVKVNDEVKTKATKAPTVTVNGAITGTATGNVTKEVCSGPDVYSLTNTATKGTYTDGQALTNKITMGKTADSTSYVNAGCEDRGCNWSGTGVVESDTVATITNSVTMTTYAGGKEAAEESKSLTVGEISLAESYGASTKDMEKTGSNYIFCTSYGNPLYTAAGQAIPAGTTATVKAASKSITIATKFYSWIKKTSGNYTGTLGNVSLTSGNQSIAGGDQIIYPKGKTLKITWEVLGAENTPAASHYTTEEVYIALPTAGTITDASLLSSAPSDKPYKTYIKYTFTSDLPADINNAKISIA